MAENKPDNKIQATPAAVPVQPAAQPVAPAQPAVAPQAAPAAQPVAPQKPAAVPTAPVAPAAPTAAAKGSLIRSGSIMANAAARKKALFGCLGAFASLLLISLILAFVFLAQSSNGDSPVARLLGVDSGSFINGLITFVHLVFIMAALTAFTFTMVGMFKSSMAKKDDKETKKAGNRMAIISGVVLAIILILWVIVYIYLDSKRVDTSGGPTADIVTEPIDPINLTAPVEVKFDASNVSIDNKYRIVGYDWNFGDKGSGTGQVVSHTYTSKGVFTVALTVTVENKGTGEVLEGGKFTKVVSISNQALAATFTATPDSGEAPLEVSFDASESNDPDGTIDTYEWDLDEDGKYDDETKVKFDYTFDKVGTYKIGLRVTSTTGRFNVYEKEIVVKEALSPEAVIKIVGDPKEFNPGVTYTFKADDSTSPKGKIDKYQWDFGDETTPPTTKTVTHAYTKIGKYELKLKVIDETGAEGETTMTISVTPTKATPRAIITTEPALTEGALSLEGKNPFTVIFDASKTTDPDDNIVDYQWDFNGDGTPDAYEAKTTYAFDKVGTFNVTLSVIDSDNNIGKATLIVKVVERGITAVLEADKVEGEAPLSVSFDASGSTFTKGQITSYRWDFGDGTPTKLGVSSITHQYSQIGMYTAKVTVIGSDNTTDTAEQLITVRETPLTACFTSTFQEGPAPLETVFDPSCTMGGATGYFWDFGDGGTSTDSSPRHIFTTAGKFKVTLEVKDVNKTTAKANVMITVQ